MFNYIFSKKTAVSLFALFAFLFAGAQPASTISGVQCVLPGLVYQYDIKVAVKENETVKVCIENGILPESNSACTEAVLIPLVHVQWQEGKTTGKITVSSPAETKTFTVNISAPFNPGTIQTSDKQTINFKKSPPVLTCTPAKGGNCTPSFTYEWERSSDKLRWTTISTAKAANLSLSTPLEQTTFFRRKAIETKSKTTGYSNEITVFVMPAAKTK